MSFFEGEVLVGVGVGVESVGSVGALSSFVGLVG